ncbi:ABC transporter permease [Streptomyces sp. NPDC059740]|uniref:ABC transporter permease n=1 Tax=Streptomyces sp. NPDC059740 TaxID=3346926 RepID=UPI00365B18D1
MVETVTRDVAAGPLRADRDAPALGLGRRTAEALRVYGLIVAMWVRSTLAYRASFAMTTVANLVATFADFAAILVMFGHVRALGGFSLPEVAVLYGSSSTSLALADLALGSMDRLGRRVRDGTLDVLLVRPAPVLVQVAADRFALRRLGRLSQALAVLGWGLAHLDAGWTVGRVLWVVSMVVCGAVIFGAVFVVGAACQFLANDAAEVQNSFTYGGNLLLQYPPTVFGRELVRGVTFVVPLAFVNWIPALHLMGRDDPLGLPGWVDHLGPLVAAGCAVVAGAAWRLGLRSYRSTGS